MKQWVTFVQAKRESSHSNIKKVLTQHMHLSSSTAWKSFATLKPALSQSILFPLVYFYLCMGGWYGRDPVLLVGLVLYVFRDPVFHAMTKHVYSFLYEVEPVLLVVISLFILRETLVSRNVPYKSNLEGWSSKKGSK